MTRDEALALALAALKWWEGKTAMQIALAQCSEPLLCMPFDLFQNAVQEALGRPVWTHEFAFSHKEGGLMDQLRGKAPAPTFEAILDLIPAEKRCTIVRAS